MENSSDNNNIISYDPSAADPHGHAALQLTESLMHSLVASSAINLAEAHNIVSIAIDATLEIADDKPARPESLEKSISLLTDIRHSLGYAE